MQITGHEVFLFIFWLGIAYLAWMPPTWLLMRFITPKHLVERYFKEPHFNRGEIILLSVFPGSLVRTGILMAACYSERYRKGRQMKDYLKYAPRWYVTASKLFAFFALGQGLLMTILIIGLVTYTAATETSSSFVYPFYQNLA